MSPRKWAIVFMQEVVLSAMSAIHVKARLLATGLLLLVLYVCGMAAQAQFPTYTPPPIPVPDRELLRVYNVKSPDYRVGDGAYQLANGTWEAGELIFDGNLLTVKTPRGQKNLTFRYKELQQIVFPQDTFLVVTDYFDPQTNYLREPIVVRRELTRAGYEVYAYSGSQAFKPDMLLRRKFGEVETVPRPKTKTQAFMLALVEDSPTIAARVKQGEYKYADFPKLLQDYLDTKANAASAR